MDRDLISKEEGNDSFMSSQREGISKRHKCNYSRSFSIIMRSKQKQKRLALWQSVNVSVVGVACLAPLQNTSKVLW